VPHTVSVLVFLQSNDVSVTYEYAFFYYRHISMFVFFHAYVGSMLVSCVLTKDYSEKKTSLFLGGLARNRQEPLWIDCINSTPDRSGLIPATIIQDSVSNYVFFHDAKLIAPVISHTRSTGHLPSFHRRKIICRRSLIKI